MYTPLSILLFLTIPTTAVLLPRVPDQKAFQPSDLGINMFPENNYIGQSILLNPIIYGKNHQQDFAPL